MTVSANNQALTAAFIFGLVLNAASGTAFLFIKANGRFIFRDGPRLVLAIFLITATLWAQTSFAAFLVDDAAHVPCQVAVAFSSSFDQIARIALEQFILLSIFNGRKRTLPFALIQILVFLRFVAGCAFIVLQRPQFKPVCTSTTLSLPLGAATSAVDFSLTLSLLGTALSVGLRNDMANDSPDASRAKGLFLTIAGLAVWTATSVPLLLGIESMDLIPRTVVPATGLLFVLVIVAVFQYSLIGTTHELPGNSRGGSPTSDIDAAQGPVIHDVMARNITTANSYQPPNRYDELKTAAMANPALYPPSSRNGPLPMINTSITGQASVGIGGGQIQGQLFPPIGDTQRVITKGTPDDRSRAYRKMRTKSGKLAISAPIVQEFSTHNPLTRMPTIDLATAFRNEKERRDMLPNILSSNLIPSRPAPRVPSSVPRGTGIVSRKEVSRSSPADFPRKSSGELIPELPSKLLSTGASSSAQLSPGTEELRRRSPRQSPPDLPPKTPQGLGEQSNGSPGAARLLPFPPPRSPLRPGPAFTLPDIGAVQASAASEKKSPTAFLVPMPAPLKVTRESAQPASESSDRKGDRTTQYQMEVRKTIIARSQSVKANVRPSREKPPSPTGGSQSSMSSTKTFGEHKAIVGLPSNPKAMPAPLPKLPLMPQEQTVMLFNQVQYANPAAVKSIDDEVAAAVAAAAVAAAATTTATRNVPKTEDAPSMVLNRPRPTTRQASFDRPIFPAEASPANAQYHVRSASAGSAKSKLFNATVGDPTQLPPLPPLPLNATRPLPNKTKSMTIDEKMNMFYPESSTAMPEVPPLPAAPFAMQPLTSPPRQQPKPATRGYVSKFSMDSSVLPNGPRATWLNRVEEKVRQGDSRRQSSPVLPPDNLLSPSEWSDVNAADDATTLLGSVHSPARAINMQKAREIAVPQVPQLAAVKIDLVGADVEESRSSSQGEGDSEVVMVLLDPSMEHQTVQAEQLTNVEVTSKSFAWHRRVGDECPTFTRRDNGIEKPRKLPPPMPLALNRPHRPIYVEAEPSPLDSPEQALKVIEQQLKRIEEANDSPQSVDEDQNRMTLLADLEMEMGMQENHWQRIKEDMNRSSLSTIRTSMTASPIKAPQAGNVGHSINSQRDSYLATDYNQQRRSLRASQILSQAGLRPVSVSSRSSRGKQPSVETHSRNSGSAMSYLAVMPTMAQLGSPTPPDTDESESDSESEIEAQPYFSMMAPAKRPEAVLWQLQRSNPDVAAANKLWVPVAQLSSNGNDSSLLFSVKLRSTARKMTEPLKIESTALWTASLGKRKSFVPETGLWKPITPAMVVKSATKPKPAPAPILVPAPSKALALKPPRRTKRMTLLPDILESPKPLPNKRDTLGIFQFPWGERSDVPIVQPRPQTFMAIPGTMPSGRLMMPLPPPPPALSPGSRDQGYSSSFLDEYENEDDFDSLSDYGEEGSEDDFDESTLWEIASLLKSNDVPSRSSMLSEDEEQIIRHDQYGNDFGGPGDLSVPELYISKSSAVAALPEQASEVFDKAMVEGSKHDSAVLGDGVYSRDSIISETSFPVSPAFGSPPSFVLLPQESSLVARATSLKVPTMWSARLLTATTQAYGLPQTSSWQSALALSSEKTVRAELRKATPSTITSSQLWSRSIELKQMAPSLLWNTNTTKPKLWNRAMPKPKSSLYGLPQMDSWPSVLTLMPEKTVRAKLRKSSPSTISSSRLWSQSILVKQATIPSLWQITEAKPMASAYGLPQTEIWRSYIITAPSRTTHVKLRELAPATISSSQLWEPSFEIKQAMSSRLWTDPKSALILELEPLSSIPKGLDGQIASTKLLEKSVLLDETTAVDTTSPQMSPSSTNKNGWKIGGWNLWSTKKVSSPKTSPQAAEVVQVPKPTAAKQIIPVAENRISRAATNEEWDAALQAAICAGLPRRRMEASESDWLAALAEAIAAGSTPIKTPDVFEARMIGATPSLWSLPARSSPSDTRDILWGPAQKHIFTEEPTVVSHVALPVHTSRASRGEKVRSLHSTSFEFSSQALWNPARAIAQQQLRANHKDWLREESAFGWY
jgi:hypothetical protein